MFDPSLSVDMFYQVHSIETTPEGHRFSVQYEGTRYVDNLYSDTQTLTSLCNRYCDLICMDELKGLLQLSKMVSVGSAIQ